MSIATTGSNAITVTAAPNGETILESNEPWYRWLRATADLFLAGEINLPELIQAEAFASATWEAEGLSRQRELSCPAARQLRGALALMWMEPHCPCDPYRVEPCGHPARTDDDRRVRLRELMGLV